MLQIMSLLLPKLTSADMASVLARPLLAGCVATLKQLSEQQATPAELFVCQAVLLTWRCR